MKTIRPLTKGERQAKRRTTIVFFQALVRLNLASKWTTGFAMARCINLWG